jgi:hypothetical protein
MEGVQAREIHSIQRSIADPGSGANNQMVGRENRSPWFSPSAENQG